MSRSAANPSTRVCRAGVNADPTHGAVIPPLYLSSNFSFDGLEGKRRYDYTRSGNPTRDLLADALAELEGGCGAVVTSTGMAAVDLALSGLEPGDLLRVHAEGVGMDGHLIEIVGAPLL